ncbi:peptidoglycan-binding protein [Thermoanaerobacterium thermosaccharolyticum]|uniref:Peptidoglycan-binding protein n=1 Tax=Thermoanaerobacterium thermosaccharolyticum TaxID=1517 RepID=A0A231VG49_THETR|nr:SPOCS domain-containing protein [Thermoanaerobacterium thermosaccharolyticum]AST57624.1 peptidoglycan-binding protein [Thermoanaerobacterium thermosaccharolyticum]OXT07163.1 peptidoglycan-binding protein [Thermoanaerobacterium thermosaccharolyticum]
MLQGALTNTISYDRFVGGEDSQALIESDVIVPEDMPDAINVIAVLGDTVINEVTESDEKIQVDGELRLNIIYVADKEKKLMKINKSIDFTHFLEISGSKSKCKSLVNARVEHVDYSLINSRKMNVKAIVSISGRAFDKEKKEAIVGIQGEEDIEYLKKTVKLSNIVGQNSAETFLKEQVKISDGEPNISRILKADILIKPEEPKITDNRVVIQGSVHVYVVYEGDSKDEYGYEECDLNYANFIEVPGALSYMRANTYERIIEKNIEISSDENGDNRIIDIELVLKTEALVVEKDETEIPVDIYGITRNVEPVIESIEAISEQERFKSQAIFKENVEFKNNVRRIIDVVAYPVLSDYTLKDGKVLLEGIIDYNIMYIGDNDNPMSFKGEAQFKTFLDVPIDDGELFIDLKITHISYDIMAMKEAELKFVVDATVDAFKLSKYDILVDVKENDEARSEENRHSITIYMVQKDDELWDIAKRYRTAKEDIIKVNDLKEEKVLAGSKLIIPNKI